MKWPTDDWQSILQSGEWVAPQDRANLRAQLGRRRLWLASASPRRREMLSQCGVRYRVLSHTLEEPPPHGPNWRNWVRLWSMRKAIDSAKRVKNGIVVSADTIVVHGSLGLGKPRDAEHAKPILRSLAGHTHRVFTGVAAIDAQSGRKAAGSAVSFVRFRRLSNREIAAYVRSRECLDKAGAYAIQGEGGKFVDRIDGPLDNIIGLPVGCLNSVLKRVLS